MQSFKKNPFFYGAGANEIHLAQWPFFDTSQLWLAKPRTEENKRTQMTLPWARPRICQQSRVQRIFEPAVASGLLFWMFINGPILCKVLYYYFESIYISRLPQHPVTLIMLWEKILFAAFFFFNNICQNFN